MFKITPNPTFKTKVLLSVPGDGTEKGEIEVEFKYFTPDQLVELRANRKDESSETVLSDIIVNWDGPVDVEGKTVMYSRETLSQLLANYHAATSEIISAFNLGLSGSRIKN